MHLLQLHRSRPKPLRSRLRLRSLRPPPQPLVVSLAGSKTSSEARQLSLPLHRKTRKPTRSAKGVATENAVRLAVKTAEEMAAEVVVMVAGVNEAKALDVQKVEQKDAPKVGSKAVKPKVAPLALSVQNVVNALPAKAAVTDAPSHAQRARQKVGQKSSQNSWPKAPKSARNALPARVGVSVAAKAAASAASVAHQRPLLPSR